jgi:hypothetical protein
VFGSERLTGALLDRLTHHVHILEMNGESYRLKQSKQRQRADRAARSLDPSCTVRVGNWLTDKEKSRFEAACDAKWRISADLPAANGLR